MFELQERFIHAREANQRVNVLTVKEDNALIDKFADMVELVEQTFTTVVESMHTAR